MPRSLCALGWPGSPGGRGRLRGTAPGKSPRRRWGDRDGAGPAGEGGTGPPDTQDPAAATSPTGQAGDSCSGASGDYKKKGTAALLLNIRLHSLTHATAGVLGFFLFSFLTINNLFLLGFKLLFFFPFPFKLLSLELCRSQFAPAARARQHFPNATEATFFVVVFTQKKQKTRNSKHN